VSGRLDHAGRDVRGVRVRAVTLLELHVKASGQRVSYAASAITIVAESGDHALIRVDGIDVDVRESYEDVVAKLKAAS
jgi:hypothetical protein